MHEWLRSLTEGGGPSATPAAPEILMAIVFSFLLTTIIAKVYQATYRGTLYSQDYVHSLIIFGTVVTAVMMVVQGDLATAFGIFAAFSIIRFRRALPQTRDIAFIFFAMVVGMGVGAREYALAAATTLVVALVVIVISKYDWFAPSRPSHLLRVRVTDDLDIEPALKRCLAASTEQADLLSIESTQAGLLTELRYSLRLKPDVEPGQFLNAIREINGNNRVVLSSIGNETRFDE